jgi:hypothetical protein
MKYSTEWDLSSIPRTVLSQEWTRRMRAARGDQLGGRPKKTRPCPKCGQPFGARDLRAHVPKCEPPQTVVFPAIEK